MRRVALPWSRSCFVCGEENELGLRARSYLVEERVELEFTPRPGHGGWNGVTHGGLVATVLDEVMTWAAIIASETPCFAAEFSVRLKTPLVTGTPCLAVADPAAGRRRVFDTRARLVGLDGQLFATATGRYMRIPPGHGESMHTDLVEVPGCWPARRIFEAANVSAPDGNQNPLEDR